MKQQHEVFEPELLGYKVLCECCGAEVGKVLIVEGSYIGECCADKREFKPKVIPETSMGRLRILKPAA
jgi:hypothetical protein